MSDAAPVPAEQTELATILEGLLPTIDALDLAADDAAAQLEAAHPMAGETMQRVRSLCALGLEGGWLAPREAGPKVRFGRFAVVVGISPRGVSWNAGALRRHIARTT